ncbi:hypothetical protein FGO68_gene11936 [Halteria grandinella]|uniref:Uncharacterized protein n=1 Tax=Halteria grandinella TaxID=5974 RepID=A0A8J8SWA7_HALGN|nr:hypothetical protein FGO68_gene11936 [Halteria grandinella]
MDMLQTDKWLGNVLDGAFSEDELNGDEAVNGYFDDSGFGSRIAVYNLGSTLVFMAGYAGAFLLMAILQPFKSSSKGVERFSCFLQSVFLWNGIIRFVIQQFQPLLLSSLINLTLQQGDYTSSSLGMKFSYLLSLTTFTLLAFSLFAFTTVLIKGKISDNCLSLSEGLNQNSPQGRFYTPLTLLKWSLLSAILVLLRDYPAQQLQLQYLLSLASSILQITGKPQAQPAEQSISTFNEVITTVYIMSVIGLCGVEDQGMQEWVGYAQVGVIGVTFMVNIGKVVKSVIVESLRQLKRYLKRINKRNSGNKVIQLQAIQTPQPIITQPFFNEQVLDNHTRQSTDFALLKNTMDMRSRATVKFGPEDGLLARHRSRKMLKMMGNK